MWASISSFFQTLGQRFSSPHIIIDIIDILVVAVLVYKVLQLAVQTRAEQLLKGFALIGIMYLVSRWLDMVALSFIMDTILKVGLLALVILFQPEIRSALERMGRISMKGSLFNFGKDAAYEVGAAKVRETVETVSAAAAELAAEKTGALIAFERITKLGEIVETGTVLDCDISGEMIKTIFYTGTPLHDGAVVIAKNRIRAAGCFLPLSQNTALSRELGTRHRAALGLSEVSDALVVVVSEETGKISLVENGQMRRGLSPIELRSRLFDALKPRKPETQNEKRKIISGGAKKSE